MTWASFAYNSWSISAHYCVEEKKKKKRTNNEVSSWFSSINDCEVDQRAEMKESFVS